MLNWNAFHKQFFIGHQVVLKTDRCVEDKEEKKSEQNFVAVADNFVKLAKNRAKFPF